MIKLAARYPFGTGPPFSPDRAWLGDHNSRFGIVSRWGECSFKILLRDQPADKQLVNARGSSEDFPVVAELAEEPLLLANGHDSRKDLMSAIQEELGEKVKQDGKRHDDPRVKREGER